MSSVPATVPETRFKPLIETPEPDAEAAAVRDFILGLARDHAAGEIDHWAIRQQSIGKDRHIAVQLTPRDHPDWPALMAMLKDLIANDPTDANGWQYATRQGMFSSRDIESAGGQIIKLATPDGAPFLAIRFPFRKTVMGEPVYRHLAGHDPEHGRMADTPDAAMPPVLTSDVLAAAAD